MHSERENHRMYEQWHPLGIVGIISAFEFPVAVWNWNTTLAWICGDVCIWETIKQSACVLACHNIWNEVAAENNLPRRYFMFISKPGSIGEKCVKMVIVPLVSATGSTRVGPYCWR